MQISQVQQADVDTQNSVGAIATAANETSLIGPEAIQVIINNQTSLANRIINIEKSMQDISSQIFNLSTWIKNNPVSSRPQSSMSAMSSASNVSITTEPSAPIVINLIANESDLLEFEKSIEDVSYRSIMVDHFAKMFSGVMKVLNIEPGDTSKLTLSMALQLERKMFTEGFWSTTAWTGGRKFEGPEKFMFATHIAFMTIFNDTLHRICGTQMSEVEFAEFIKGRTRNSHYQRNTARKAATRTSRKRKHMNGTEEQNPLVEKPEEKGIEQS